MISVFDMNDPGKKWIDNVEVFDEPIRCIAIKKKGRKAKAGDKIRLQGSNMISLE